jgi:hypothetical protein
MSLHGTNLVNIASASKWYANELVGGNTFNGARLSESESRIRHYLAEIDRLIGRVG